MDHTHITVLMHVFFCGFSMLKLSVISNTQIQLETLEMPLAVGDVQFSATMVVDVFVIYLNGGSTAS